MGLVYVIDFTRVTLTVMYYASNLYYHWHYVSTIAIFMVDLRL